jgi:DNA-binding transcriptional LysR family regulator
LTIDCSTKIVNLDKSEADIAIRGTTYLPDHLIGRRLFTYSLSYYAHKTYFAKNSRNELAWIAPAVKEGWAEWLAESPYPEAPIQMVITDIVTRFKALEAGFGLSRAACFMADPHPDLIRLPGAKVIEQPEIWVLTHPDLRDTARIKLLMQYLIDALSNKKDLLKGN